MLYNKDMTGHNYLTWNEKIANYFFRESAAGAQCYLDLDEDVLIEIGGNINSVEDFLQAVSPTCKITRVCKISKIILEIVSSILLGCISRVLSKVAPKRYSQQITGSELRVS